MAHVRADLRANGAACGKSLLDWLWRQSENDQWMQKSLPSVHCNASVSPSETIGMLDPFKGLAAYLPRLGDLI